MLISYYVKIVLNNTFIKVNILISKLKVILCIF